MLALPLLPALKVAWAAPSPVSIKDFVALSERLTGQTGLDELAAHNILDALTMAGKADAVASLVDGGNGSSELANEIVAAWYSGVVSNGTSTIVATFDSALMWQAMSFTKPWAMCGGTTGYWADPPE